MQPLDIPTWTTRPSADQLERAIVGASGSWFERDFATTMVRDTVLTAFVKAPTMQALEYELDELRRMYEHEPGESLGRLVRACVKSELGRLVYESMALSQVRLKQDLWPDEPFPEDWSPGAEVPKFASTDQLVVAANGLDGRLDYIEGRYGIVGPGEERSAALIRNSVNVARTGNHETTYGPVHKVLRSRGVLTMRLPEATPW